MGFFETTGTASRLGETTLTILEDRMELFALELREAKLRFFQALLWAGMAVMTTVFGLLLLVVAGLYVLPGEWRVYLLVGMGGLALGIGGMAFVVLGRHLDRRPLAFDQTLAELKKDAACFSARS